MIREWVIVAAVGALLVMALVGWAMLVRSFEDRRLLVRRSRHEGLRRHRLDPTQRLEQWVRGTRIGGALTEHLTAAGMTLRTVDFLAINLGAFLMTRFLVERFLSAILAVPFGIAVVVGIWLWVQHQRKRQMARFIGQLPELARLLSNSVASGLGLLSSLELAAKELDNPAGKEVNRLVQEIHIGQSLEDALAHLTERAPSREIDVLVSTLVIQQRTGGNTVESLRDMAETLEKRKELNREVQTLISESLFTAYAVAGMGFALLLILNALYPGVLDEMLRSPVGLVVLALSGMLYVGGFLAIRRLSRLEV